MSKAERIQVLGTGCAKCDKLESNVIEALKEMNMDDIPIGHVRDVIDIANFGVMMTPALAIDGKAVSAGKVLSIEEIKSLIKNKM